MPEKNSLRIGYVPLLDAAPLAVAQALGYFAEAGLEVELVPFGAWASVRDRLMADQLDAAHLLAPMVPASRLGIEGLQTPLVSAFGINRNGNTIVVSGRLHEELRAAAAEEGLQGAAAAGRAMHKIVEARRQRGGPRLVLAHVHPHSMHHLLLRSWLLESGLDPERDVRFCVLPPSQTTEHLRSGNIDAFCAGAPWGALAEIRAGGRCLLTGAEIWPDHPEKMLAVTEAWAAEHPRTHRALVAALLRAAQWAETGQHRDALVQIMTSQMLGEITPQLLTHILERKQASGGPRYFGANANLPDPAQAAQMMQALFETCGRPLSAADLAEAGSAFLPQLFHEAEAIAALEPVAET